MFCINLLCQQVQVWVGFILCFVIYLILGKVKQPSHIVTRLSVCVNVHKCYMCLHGSIRSYVYGTLQSAIRLYFFTILSANIFPFTRILSVFLQTGVYIYHRHEYYITESPETNNSH